MIHPSYTELIQAVNKDVEESDTPVCNSRYSIVLATSKRARQLIAGAEPMVSYSLNKPLSIAVDEVYKGKVTIIPDTEDVEEAEAEAALEKNWKRKTKTQKNNQVNKRDAAWACWHLFFNQWKGFINLCIYFHVSRM